MIDYDSYERWTDHELMAEVNRRPSERESDLKWAALLYASLYRQGEFSDNQRQILIDILHRSDEAEWRRNPPDFSDSYEFHDEYGKPY